MPKLLVLTNRAAGTADDESVTAVLAELRRGADVEVADARDLDQALAGRGDRRVVAVGGDGSVHAVVAALDRLGALDPADPLGIVPLGTGNDLARALDLPLDPVGAARTVLDGATRRLDLIRDDAGGVVVNAVHGGVGARAGAESERFKDRLGSAAYPLGAAIAGLTETGWALRIEADGRPVTSGAGWAADGGTDVLMFAVCNGTSIAGGTPMAPAAVLDDGGLQVVVCTATGPVARAAFAAALLRGTHGERDDVVITTASELRFSGPPVDLDADGEIEEGVAARTWQVAPAAWSVLAVGSSRVDLQACKLEYSIVSPK